MPKQVEKSIQAKPCLSLYNPTVQVAGLLAPPKLGKRSAIVVEFTKRLHTNRAIEMGILEFNHAERRVV
jgi:hypothetical protein